MSTAEPSPPALLFRCDLSRPALPFRSTRTFVLLVLVWLALPGAGFVIAGAWPVMGFLGLEFILLGGAFWVYRNRAARRDVIQIRENELALKRIDAQGRVLAELHLPPHWVQVENVEPGFGPRMTQGHILIRSHGDEYRIADYLTYGEREALVDDLKAALTKTRV